MINMSEKDLEFSRFFTVEEANAALPLVRAICQDLSTLSREVVERRERLALLLSGRDQSREDMYRQELAQIEEELERDSGRIEEFVQELRDLGVEPKNATEGLVDFPSKLEDRTVLLCWKLDEPEVLYWHELADGFQGRQPLVVSSGPAGQGGPLDQSSGAGDSI